MGLVGLGPGLAAVGTGHAAGVNYYVSTSGADSTCKAGQSSSTPLRTIGFALDCAANDKTTASRPDTIQVAAGTYDEHNLTVNANVTVAGQPARTTVDAEDRHTCRRLAHALLDLYLAARGQDEPPRRILLDLDSTDGPTYGQQEGTAYHGYYRPHMYHPLLIFRRRHRPSDHRGAASGDGPGQRRTP
jgi:hypothetical protein